MTKLIQLIQSLGKWLSQGRRPYIFSLRLPDPGNPVGVCRCAQLDRFLAVCLLFGGYLLQPDQHPVQVHHIYIDGSGANPGDLGSVTFSIWKLFSKYACLRPCPWV